MDYYNVYNCIPSEFSSIILSILRQITHIIKDEGGFPIDCEFKHYNDSRIAIKRIIAEKEDFLGIMFIDDSNVKSFCALPSDQKITDIENCEMLSGDLQQICASLHKKNILCVFKFKMEYLVE